ncbi:hypothetical protein IEU95_06805 [Hoyosella rhizosphaerae]|uniref:Uncharacterized protein n=1 Tax=Hoyosella rhizosphaerae TaxID=1755582 RepID=A0A916U2Y6_9ACTN|nr:hypothetical protein [Hoyosella rhizosphaerae]MBN4926532.1 hypothetical protein [Hoyosella rhizosphaerae]GGC58532.1 hypothetical protein GCM10011410_08780 [Hoyosella rhizosphaerae]
MTHVRGGATNAEAPRHRPFAAVSIACSVAAATYFLTATNVVDASGPTAYISLSVPVILGIIALVNRHRIVVLLCAILLVGYCVLGLLSVGAYFIPAAFALSVGAALRYTVKV